MKAFLFPWSNHKLRMQDCVRPDPLVSLKLEHLNNLQGNLLNAERFCQHHQSLLCKAAHSGLSTEGWEICLEKSSNGTLRPNIPSSMSHNYRLLIYIASQILRQQASADESSRTQVISSPWCLVSSSFYSVQQGCTEHLLRAKQCSRHLSFFFNYLFS